MDIFAAVVPEGDKNGVLNNQKSKRAACFFKFDFSLFFLYERALDHLDVVFINIVNGIVHNDCVTLRDVFFGKCNKKNEILPKTAKNLRARVAECHYNIYLHKMYQEEYLPVCSSHVRFHLED